MPRWLILLAALLLALVIASQLLLPGLAESQVEDQLTEGGGEAAVSLSAFPAARLLFDDGSRFEATASDLDLDLSERVDVFDRLDGFDEVEMAVADSIAGPFAIESFSLTRDAPGPYRMLSTSEAVPAELVDLGADRLGLPGGDLLGGLAANAFGERPVPIELEMEFVSEDGRIEVTSGGSTVAGVPTGPLGELIAASIVAQL